MKTNALNELIGTLGLFQTKLFQYQFHLSGKYQKIKDDISGYSTRMNNLMLEVGAIILERGETPVSSCGEFIEYAWIKEHPYSVNLSDQQLVEDLQLDLKSILSSIEDRRQYFSNDEVVLAIFDRIENVINNELTIITK